MKPLPGFGKASIFLTDMSVQENSSKHVRQDGIEWKKHMCVDSPYFLKWEATN